MARQWNKPSTWFRPKPPTVTGGDSSSIDRGSPNFGKPTIVTVPVTPSTPQTGVNPYVGRGGGGSGGSRVSLGEAVAMAGGASAQQAAAQAQAQQAEAQRQAQANAEKAVQAQQRQNQIVVQASGGVRVGWGTGAQTYVGNAVIPSVGLTANVYARQQRLKAIEQGIIDKKDYGRATLTIQQTPTAQTQQRETRTVTTPQSFQSQSAIAMLPRGDLPSFKGFVLGNQATSQVGFIDRAKQGASNINRLSTKYLGVNLGQGFTRAKETATSIYDVTSGMSYTLGGITKEQSKLNIEIEKYNVQYGGKELSDQEFKSAQEEMKRLDSAQLKISRQRDEVVQSKPVQIYNFFNPTDRRLTTAEIEKQSLSGGAPVILTGSLPIAPTIYTSAKVLGVGFFGKEKALKGGQTAINIAYKTTKGRTGQAIAVIKQDGQLARAAVIGRSSGKAVSFPSGRIVPIKMESYKAIEKSIGKAGNIQWSNAKTGQLSIQRIVEGQKQVSLGRAVSQAGSKIPTTGKGVRLTDFISASKSITKNRVSFIKGGTVTSIGNKARFSGAIIKAPDTKVYLDATRLGTSGGSSLVKQNTLNKVLSSIAATESRITPVAKTSPGLVFAGVTSIGSVQISKPATRATTVQTTRQAQRQATIPIQAQRQATIPIQTTSSMTAQLSRTMQGSSQIQQQKVEQVQVVRQAQRTGTIQKSAQRLALRQQQQIIQKSMSRGVMMPTNVMTKFGGMFIYKIPKSIKSQSSFGRVPVFVRRFGKWKSIGFGRTKEQALFKGKRYSQRTLGRSFYVPGVKPRQILPGFRTKMEKGKGLIYIQKTGKGAISTLGTGSEKAEIQFFRRMKGGKK